MNLERDRQEVYDLVDECNDIIHGTSEGTKFRGHTFEEGIVAATLWLVGDSDEYPLEP